ncbi:hypothetical protein WR25_08973 [Diploscapter pachys]|uniref:Cytochrome P450 n=1 Tax=Diploscapter pachys TaxID=2018661 RepID=A0A2A2LSW4_9BILA|nr:hypothetical protein WR25_08973 [Diploscapter pachys]
MEQLKNACLDIWAAGSDTTTNTITWTVLYVLHHPEVAIKMYEELDANIGGGRLITLNDKHKLSYISAVINETQRLANIVVNPFIHTTTTDVVFIPFGTGKRSCIGEGLAKTELFLFIANIYNQFEEYLQYRTVNFGCGAVRYEIS